MDLLITCLSVVVIQVTPSCQNKRCSLNDLNKLYRKLLALEPVDSLPLASVSKQSINFYLMLISDNGVYIITRGEIRGKAVNSFQEK